MSQPLREGTQRGNLNQPPLSPKPALPPPSQGMPATKSTEIESIKRTLYNVLDKLDRLQR